MKRATIAGIIGVLLIFIFLVGIGAELMDPSHLLLVNVANIITNLCWMGLGLFLLLSSINAKKAEDKGEVLYKPDLSYRRNRIFAYILTITFIGSISTWILTDYKNGQILITISSIFDIAINISFAYLAVQLFRNKDVLRPLLYVFMLYGIGGLVLGFLRHDIPLTVSQSLFFIYFLYAIKAPLTTHSHRIAHFVLLPLFVVLTVAVVQIDQIKISKMLKEEIRLEKEYVNIDEDINYAYLVPFEKKSVSNTDIQKIENGFNTRDKKAHELTILLNKIKEEFLKEDATEEQIISLEKIDHTLLILEIYKAQSEKGRQLLEYYRRIGDGAWTNEEQVRIHEIAAEIDEYNRKARDLGLEFDTR